MNHYLNKLMTYQLVHQMEQEGFSTKKISEHCKMSWRTARRLLSLSEKEYLNEGAEPSVRKRSLDIYEDFVKERCIFRLKVGQDSGWAGRDLGVF